MMNSKTMNDLVASYREAKKSQDSFAINAAESALASFTQAEAAMVSMRVSEAVAAGVTGFTPGKK